MHKRKMGLLILSAFLIPGSLVLGRSRGIFSNGGSMNKGWPGCSNCHGSPGDLSISIVSAIALQKNIRTPVDFKVAGASGTTGGFSMDTDTGQFQAGAGSKVQNNKEITHTDNSRRLWQFNFNPTQTGLVKWYATGMASNGSGSSGDLWGWWGPDTKKPGTPYRLFVSDVQVKPFGDSCAGTMGFKPVIGIAENVTRNKIAKIELHNVKPGSPVLYILGISNKFFGAIPLPFDLGLIGAPGCKLYVSMDLTLPGVALGTGDGGGSTSWSLPIPGGVQGVTLYHQVFVIDPVNQLRLITSMGLESTIQ